MQSYLLVSLLLNKIYKGLGTTTKKKETRGDTDGTIILFLYPLIFYTKIPMDNIIVLCVSPLVSFLFSVVPNLL